jgi:hypothetical protein
MSCTIPAYLLNTVGKTLKVWLSGFYYTTGVGGGGSPGYLTMAVELGTVNICSRQTGATYASGISNATPDFWEMTCYITTQTSGTSGLFEAQGLLVAGLTTTQTGPADPYPILNTATVGTVNTETTQTIQVTVTFSTNQTSGNSATERQLIVEVVN